MLFDILCFESNGGNGIVSVRFRSFGRGTIGGSPRARRANSWISGGRRILLAQWSSYNLKHQITGSRRTARRSKSTASLADSGLRHLDSSGVLVLIAKALSERKRTSETMSNERWKPTRRDKVIFVRNHSMQPLCCAIAGVDGGFRPLMSAEMSSFNWGVIHTLNYFKLDLNFLYYYSISFHNTLGLKLLYNKQNYLFI
jgi:hypothetical protein